VSVGSNEVANEVVLFKVGIADIEEYLTNNSYFFVGVYSEVDTTYRTANASTTNQYRFIY